MKTDEGQEKAKYDLTKRFARNRLPQLRSTNTFDGPGDPSLHFLLTYHTSSHRRIEGVTDDTQETIDSYNNTDGPSEVQRRGQER